MRRARGDIREHKEEEQMRDREAEKEQKKE